MVIVLAVLVVRRFSGIRRPVDLIGKTRALMAGLSMAQETYRSMYEALPPDSGVGLHPDLDKPAECLAFYLSGPTIFYDPAVSPLDAPWDHEIYDTSRRGAGRRSLPRFYDFHTRSLKDEDKDGIPEVVDSWGNPLLYNTGAKQNGPFNQNGAPTHNKPTYDLSSAGPDGEHGTEDDITNWQGK